MNTTAKKKPAPAPASRIDLSGLESFSLKELTTGGLSAAGGRPLEIPLDQIVEDATQARTDDNPGFSAESLQELADSIVAGKGVKTPISVRSKNAEGLYVINHGARRYRASKIAGLATIRAFIDDEHDDYDQAVENIQREAFTPIEIARFIHRRLEKGDSRATVAKRLGKSKAFVTQHAALIDMPRPLTALYDEGRCRDATTLYELAMLEKTAPQEVEAFLARGEDVTRSSVAALKEAVRPKPESQDRQPSTGPDKRTDVNPPDQTDQAPTDHSSGPAMSPRSAPRLRGAVMVRHRKDLFLLRPDLKPSAIKMGWIEDPKTNETTEVELAELRIDSIVAA